MSVPQNSPSSSGIRIDVCVSIALVAIGGIFAGFGLFHYGVWINRGPGPGFFPLLAGLLTAIPAAISLFDTARGSVTPLVWSSMLPAVGVVVALLLVPVIGMVEAMSLFILVWVRLVEKRSWRDALLSAIGGLVITHLIFSVWLGVYFPDSLVPSIVTLWN